MSKQREFLSNYKIGVLCRRQIKLNYFEQNVFEFQKACIYSQYIYFFVQIFV